MIAPRHLGERQVRRRERDAQPPRDQQHHRVRAAGFRGEVFRVSLERNPGVVDRGLSAPARSPSPRSGRRCSPRRRRRAGRARSGRSPGPAGPASPRGRAAPSARAGFRHGAVRARRLRCHSAGLSGRPSRPARAASRSGSPAKTSLEWPVGKRGREREVGTDAGGLAGRDDDAPSGQGFLIST